MFGINKITTKIDPAAAFKLAIDKAVSEARDARVASRIISDYLLAIGKRVEDQAHRVYTPPRMHDASGKPIDENAMVAEAEAARKRRADKASEIPLDQRQSAASGYRK